MQATNDADNWVFYTPNGPDKKLIGSEFTSFFLAAVDNPKLNGMRLKKVGSLSPHPTGSGCSDNTPQMRSFLLPEVDPKVN